MRARFSALLVLLTSCGGFDLVSPDPRPTVLLVNLVVAHDTTSRYSLTATFFRGSDVSGNVLALSDSALVVDEDELAPSGAPNSDVWFYSWADTRTNQEVLPDSLRVRIPLLPGSPALQPHVLTIPLIVRTDPVDVTLVGGEDLILRFSRSQSAANVSLAAAQWSLELRKGDANSGGALVRITGADTASSELRVPWTWLRSVDENSVAASLTLHETYQAPGAPYNTGVQVSTQLSWRVALQPLGPSAAASTRYQRPSRSPKVPAS